MDKWKELLAKLAEMDAKALDEVRADAVKAFEPLNKKDTADLTDEELAEMEAIGDFLEGVDARNTEITVAAEERTAKVERTRALAEAAKAAPKADEKPADEKTADEDPAVDPAKEVVVGEVVDDAKEPALVASAKRTSVARAAAGNSKVPVAESGNGTGITLVAGAGIRGFENGQSLNTLDEAAPAIWDRLQALPTEGDGLFAKNQAITIKLPHNPLNDVDFRSRESLMFLQAGEESKLQGSSLVAAGGWGAPSEQLLDFCPLETTDGLIQLPEVTVNRPGISYTRGPDFEDVFNSNTGFWDMTEATAEAGTELKTSLRPEVPDFLEARLDAVGVMMECGLLLRAGWPELVERYAQMALIAHQMKVAAKVLGKVRQFTGPAIDLTGVGFGTELDILSVLELVAMGERQRFAMGEKQTLEVLLPSWLKAAIRAGIMNRTGQLTDPTDQQITAHFTSRNLRVQWLNLYSQLDVTTSGVAVAYPSTVEAIMYPAGTYVKGVKPVITLDTIYDSVNLKKNDYVHLFVESGVMVTNPCGTGRRISIPLNINGRTAAADITADFGGITAPAV